MLQLSSHCLLQKARVKINICPGKGEANGDENKGKKSEKGTKMHRIITKKK